MKFLFILLYILGVGSGLSHAALIPEARVIRIAYRTNSSTWRPSEKEGQSRVIVCAQTLTNELVRLNLHFGDLVLVFDDVRHKLDSDGGLLNWLRGYCYANRVAIYPFNSQGDTQLEKDFLIPVFHWVAPYEDPNQMDKATFFREGIYLGLSTNGFGATLARIRLSRMEKVFLLGSQWDFDSCLPSMSSPFGGDLLKVISQMSAYGVDLIVHEPMM
jgi:hypothetical protein